MFGAKADIERASFSKGLECLVKKVESCFAAGTGYGVYFGLNGEGRESLCAWDER